MHRRGGGDAGPMVLPGNYTVRLAKHVGSVETPLGEPQTFETVPADRGSRRWPRVGSTPPAVLKLYEVRRS